MGDIRKQPATKADIATLREQWRADISQIKVKVASLETDIATLKTDIATLKSDVLSLKTEIKSVGRKLSIEIIKTHAKIDNLEERLAAKIDHSHSQLMKVMQDIAGQFQDQKRTNLVFDKILGEHDERLDHHEERLLSLEPKT